jgi:EAL domain-containing protein (putative c-di-GMP-specific phosphodiesterase class I)/PAS domain-containing protein
MPRRPLRVFVVVMAAQCLVTVLALRPQLGVPGSGPREAEFLLAVGALAWLVPTAAIGLYVVAAAGRYRRDLHERAQAIAATEDLSRDWVWQSDADARLTYSNGAVRDLLGREPLDLLGTTCEHLIVPAALPGINALVRQSIEQRGTLVPDGPLEAPWVHADGHTVNLQGSTRPIHDERGVVVGYRGTRQLLTEAMLAERTATAAASRVSRMLQEHAFDIALQPVIDLTTGRVNGVEALARFRDGRPPDVWFREAAESGLALDRMAFMAALDLLPSLPDGCRLSINASPELLTDDAFQQRLRAPDLAQERVVVEITEHVRIDSYADVADALAPLRELGVGLAVDDTGAGFASLTHVLQLHPDIIKIDRSLVCNVTSDPARRGIITALVLLALDLGASVTAEGVETPSELESVGTMGADHVQGYLLARPSTDPARWSGWWDRNWIYPTTIDLDAERKAGVALVGG